MSNNLVDFSFVYEMSDNDSTYVHEVATLFLKTASEGLVKLKELIDTEDDLEVIRRQAHFLKSSANVVKVKGMYDNLVMMEGLARMGACKERMKTLIVELLDTFNAARPEIEAEIVRCAPGNK